MYPTLDPYNAYQQAQSQIQNQLNGLLKPSVSQQTEVHTIKVNGRAGAEALSVGPNSDIFLFCIMILFFFIRPFKVFISKTNE